MQNSLLFSSEDKNWSHKLKFDLINKSAYFVFKHTYILALLSFDKVEIIYFSTLPIKNSNWSSSCENLQLQLVFKAKLASKCKSAFPNWRDLNYIVYKMLQADQLKQCFLSEINGLKQMEGGKKNFPRGTVPGCHQLLLRDNVQWQVMYKKKFKCL